MTSALASIGAGMAFSAMLIYVVLRFIAANTTAPDSGQRVAQHALWTSVIALFASGTSGLVNLWRIEETQVPNAGNFENLFWHAAAPGAWLGIIYVIGQYTWPRHLQPVRSASLEVRSATKLFPKLLSVLLLVATLLSAVAISFAWNDAGAPARTGNSGAGWITEDGSPYTGEIDGNGNPLNVSYDGAIDLYGMPIGPDGYLLSEEEIEEMNANIAFKEVDAVSSIDGTRPGTVVGPYLAGGLGLLLLSVLGVVALISHRPPLQTMDPDENQVLRSIWINRLLRTALIAVSGFGVMSLNYMAEGVRARAMWDMPENEYSIGGSAVEATANWLSGCGAAWMLIVIFLAAAWTPPRLRTFQADAAHANILVSAAYAKARNLLLRVQGLGITAALAIVMVAGLWIAQDSGTSYVSTAVPVDGGPITEVDQSANAVIHASSVARGLENQLLVLLLIFGFYLVTQIIAARLMAKRWGSKLPVDRPYKELLPLWFIIIICVAIAVFCSAVVTFMLNTASQVRPIGWLLVMIVLGVAAAAVLLYSMASRRNVLDGTSAREDRELRILVAHRGTRMLGGIALVAASILNDQNNWVHTTLSGYPSYPLEAEPSIPQILCLVLGVALCFLPASTAYSRRAAKPRPSVSSDA